MEENPYLKEAVKVGEEANNGIVGDIKQEIRKVKDLKNNNKNIKTNKQKSILIYLKNKKSRFPCFLISK